MSNVGDAEMIGDGFAGWLREDGSFDALQSLVVKAKALATNGTKDRWGVTGRQGPF